VNRVLLKDGVPEKFKLLGHPPLSHLLDIKCLIGIPVQAGTRVNEKYGFSQSHPALILRLITNSSYLKHTINILLSTAKFDGVAKKLPLLRCSGFSDTRHTTCIASSLKNHCALPPQGHFLRGVYGTFYLAPQGHFLRAPSVILFTSPSSLICTENPDTSIDKRGRLILKLKIMVHTGIHKDIIVCLFKPCGIYIITTTFLLLADAALISTRKLKTS